MTDKLPDGIFKADDWIGNFLAALKEHTIVKTCTVDDNIVSLQVIFLLKTHVFFYSFPKLLESARFQQFGHLNDVLDGGI